MNVAKKATYVAILGSPKKPIVISMTLPRLGEHGFKWVVAEAIGKEYGHYGFKLHPKANPVNVHVYGERSLIERLSATGKSVVCQVEIVVKKTTSEREFILVNLYLTDLWRHLTHEFEITRAPSDRPWFVYTTKDMHGVGVSLKPLS